ncbi:uncharacterized protein LOC122612830 [Drosophila teissieri]|uniref:uncharacterized protein LOC122612830 n=1 Tax=Drosophila teissieri TaxID=7243 RepID=UPI001CBA4A72|nr:uncharacterized protein LOC122612830 [Drosophila teissieri]
MSRCQTVLYVNLIAWLFIKLCTISHEMYQVHKINSISTNRTRSYIKKAVETDAFSVSSKSRRNKGMEDCEIIGMIFEIIGDMLFGSDTSSSSDDDYDSSST